MTSTRALILMALVTQAALFTLISTNQAGALGFNTAMLYRYPWIGGESMTRTQGWGGSLSHTGSLQYAVDWDNGSGNWLVHSANGGQIKCDPEGGLQAGFGNFIGVYNSVADEMSVYAHLTTCGYFSPGVLYDGAQGQGLAPAGNTGNVTGIHLHYHVIAGSNLTGVHSTVPFAMSDRDNFSATGANGSSDNFWVGDDGVGGTDASIRTAYLANGGPSAAWWNVGASWATGIGPCVLSQSPFVHKCNTRRGANTFRVQNYIGYDGKPAGVADNYAGSVGYLINGANWRLLAGTYSRGGGTTTMTYQLGPPTSAESGGSITSQTFGTDYYISRYTYRTRQDVILGGVWRATYFYQTYGGECDDINGDLLVDLTDVSEILAHFGESEAAPPWSPLYDTNRDGSVDFTDIEPPLYHQFGNNCEP